MYVVKYNWNKCWQKSSGINCWEIALEYNMVKQHIWYYSFRKVKIYRYRLRSPVSSCKKESMKSFRNFYYQVQLSKDTINQPTNHPTMQQQNYIIFSFVIPNTESILPREKASFQIRGMLSYSRGPISSSEPSIFFIYLYIYIYQNIGVFTGLFTITDF